MDKKEFADLILHNEKQLYRIAKSILRNDTDCADAAQEAIAKGFANLHFLKQERYAKTWLIRILIHECYRILKERERTVHFEYEFEDASVKAERYSDLYEALSRMQKELRIVLVLHYLEGYSINDISEIMQIPIGTVKSRMDRGRKQLKKIMAEDL